VVLRKGRYSIAFGTTSESFHYTVKQRTLKQQLPIQIARFPIGYLQNVNDPRLSIY
jgi:hypothetical protein